ncbi:MAG: response regulator transcription factor [Dehalococcoidales bacterium]|nr:response regulator transcription factor [Dehalococcoidales bacterium]
MNKIIVMIIDEQPFFRAGVRQVLSQESDFKILDCDPAQDPLAMIEANMPNIVLLGSDLGTHSGLELSRRIARYYPNTKVIMLSPNPSDEELFEVIKTAAVACLSKNANTTELISTIRRACGGEYPINDSVMNRPRVAGRVLEQFQSTSPISKTMEAVIAPLTNRETQIMRYIADGNTNKEIGLALGISEQTIKSHVSAILRKLNANDRAHAVALAIRSSLISPEKRKQEPLQ